MEVVIAFPFLGHQSHCGWLLQPWNQKSIASWQESNDKPRLLKSRDITLLTKVCIVKTTVFPLVMYGCENWTVKKAESQRIDAFKLVLEKTPEVLGQQGDQTNQSSVQLLSCVQLWLHGLQHARLPCPSPTPGACSNSCPSIRWCSPTISSSVTRFSSCLQSFPASGSYPMSQFFASGGQSIGASASVLPMNIQDWFPLGVIVLILQFKGLSRVFSNTTVKSIHSSVLSFLYSSILTSIHDYWKNHSFD